MTEETTVQQNTEQKSSAAKTTRRSSRERTDTNARGGRKRRDAKTSNASREQRREYEQKILDIRRVTRVVAGGRRFGFSVAMAIGDQRGSVGVGVGKASDTALAIEKAARNARKNMITLRRTEDNSIPHEVTAKYCASYVQIIPAPGRGVVAGSVMRSVLELAGVTNVTAKILSRSKNKINNARATLMALSQVS